jgi:hypothetical protein
VQEAAQLAPRPQVTVTLAKARVQQVTFTVSFPWVKAWSYSSVWCKLLSGEYNELQSVIYIVITTYLHKQEMFPGYCERELFFRALVSFLVRLQFQQVHLGYLL